MHAGPSRNPHREPIHSLVKLSISLLFTVAASTTVMIAIPTLADAGSLAGRGERVPTQNQLARLSEFDQYIDYFTAQSYGPSGSRIDEAYVRALILAESGANPKARSHKGARGLSQIMPGTGRKAASDIAATGVDYRFVDESKLRNFKSDYLYEPAVNLLIACYLSATYSEQYGGRTDLVASAWNAGTHSVHRYGNRPPPYGETRGLLATIHGYMTFFQGGRTPSWPMRAWDTYGFEAPGWDSAGDGATSVADWKFPSRSSYRHR